MVTRLEEDKSFVRAAFLKQLGPVGLSVLLVQLCTILNNVVVGQLIGADALGVMSAASPVYLTCCTLGTLLATGGSTMSARMMGANKVNDVNQVFTLSVFLLVIAGGLLTAMGLAFKDQLIDLLGVPEQLRGLANDYLTAYLPGAIGVMGIYVPFNNLKLIGKQNLSAILFMIMAAVNVGLDILLAGVLKLGMTGVALATIAGAWIAFGVGMALLCGKRGGFRLQWPERWLRSLAQILRFGSVLATSNLCNTLFTLLMNRIILGRIGGIGLTAFSLIITLRSFSMSINNGVSMTLAPFAAVFSSERDSTSQRQLLKSALFMGVALTLVLAGLVVLVPGRICAMFGVTSSDVLTVAIPAIRAFGLSLPIAVVNYTMISFYANLGKTLLSNAMTVLRALALVAPIAALLSRSDNGNLLWYSYLLAEAGTLSFAFAFARIYSSKHPHTSPIALIDTRFEDDGCFIAFSVAANDRAATESAMRVTQFCEANGLKPRTTMAVSLAIEEMIVIFNKHALETHRATRASLRGSTVRLLIYRHDTVILRFRCFGVSFDPVKAADTEAGESESHEYIGVRMMQKIAKTVVYSHTFGINTLTITI